MSAGACTWCAHTHAPADPCTVNRGTEAKPDPCPCARHKYHSVTCRTPCPGWGCACWCHPCDESPEEV